MPEDRPRIAYNVSGNAAKPAYRPLAELSTGQKCTAMLVIALSDGNIPIVIDQPEDSLDIKSVWHDMCRKLRKGKERRQFIFTTHNSSLAVASDTDKFLIVEGGASTGDFVMGGSMDDPVINDEVIKYLEGDLDAYSLKSEKYNIKSKLLDR
jgi:ABC-type cobalamin/Fe3+-siderophores transport system ATPase subunit